MGQFLAPDIIFRCLGAALSVITGKADVNKVFDFSSTGFWQAIIGSWIIGMLLDIAPIVMADSSLTFSMQIHLLLLNAFVPFVGILFFASAVFHVLNLTGRADKFIRFLVPYIWVKCLAGLTVSVLALGGLVAGISWLAFAILPAGLWFLIKLYGITRAQTSLSCAVATGILIGDLAIHMMLAASAFPGMLDMAPS